MSSVDGLRTAAAAVYLAADEMVAKDLSAKLIWAAKRIEELEEHFRNCQDCHDCLLECGGTL
jgi:hypothetical protein